MSDSSWWDLGGVVALLALVAAGAGKLLQKLKHWRQNRLSKEEAELLTEARNTGTFYLIKLGMNNNLVNTNFHDFPADRNAEKAVVYYQAFQSLIAREFVVRNTNVEYALTASGRARADKLARKQRRK